MARHMAQVPNPFAIEVDLDVSMCPSTILLNARLKLLINRFPTMWEMPYTESENLGST